MQCENLFTPITINGLELPNRIVQSAMVTNFCNADGLVTEKFAAYHARRARGGWGLIITEDYAVNPTAGAFAGLPGLWDDAQIPSHAAFVERIHAAGGRIAAQIYHAGRESSRAVKGVQPVAPSPIKDPTMPDTPRELTIPEIDAIVEDFAGSARRVKAAGFDAVEIHGAHGYLITQFLSPFSNKRCDEYGGNLRNRARFAERVVRAVRAEVGPDYPILFRMSVEECVPGGLTVADSQVIARLLEEAGVDCFHCSQGSYPALQVTIPPYFVPSAAFVDNAAAIKRVVGVPVIAVGRINDPLVADTVIAQGKADLVTMARAALADADMPNKARAGRFGEIRRCIGCVQGCAGENSAGRPIRCLLDPLTGKEDEYDLAPAAEPRRVLVVGGGVSGCETAIVAARRGHAVTLVERERTLGGQWNLAATAAGKAPFADFVRWQGDELSRLRVDVRLGVPFDEGMLADGAFDVVVDATGSVPLVPPIEGLADAPYLTAKDVLGGGVVPGGSVVVIGGGLSGCEVAEHLRLHGTASVTLLEMRDGIALDGVASIRAYLVKTLSDQGVTVVTGARVTSVGAGRVGYELAGRACAVEGVDAVVLASGVRPAGNLAHRDLSACEVHAVGDAAKAKDGYHNIQEAYELGLRL